MAGGNRRERTMNELTYGRTIMKLEIACRVDENILRWFGHIGKMDTNCLNEKVMEACVNGRALSERPKFN